MINSLKGVWTAIITPFNSDGSIDWNSFTQLLKRQSDAKVRGIVVFGTTGESPTLEFNEKISLVQKAREILHPDVRVMAGSGSNNTRQSLDLSQAAETAGADSLLIVTPPYNKPSPRGLQSHIEAIAEAINIPLCLYHVPGRTGQHLSTELLSYLTTLPSIECVKEASGDIAYFSRTLNQSSASFLSGDDITYLASLAVGGVGCISVISNIFPQAVVSMTDAFSAGDVTRAQSIHQALQPLMDDLFVESNPAPVKFLSSHLGLCQNHLRLPLTPIEGKSEQQVLTAYDKTLTDLQALGLSLS